MKNKFLRINSYLHHWKRVLTLIGVALIIVGFIKRFKYLRVQTTEESQDIDQIDILFVIPSAPTHSSRRNAIRVTWFKHLNANMEARFYIGMKEMNSHLRSQIMEESVKFKDMVLLENVKDTYGKLTEKMLVIYEHVVKQHSGVRWIFKTDTDVWIDPRRLQNVLKNYSKKTMVGKLFKNSRVLRSGRYANTKYSGSRYPAYASGAGYALSFDIVEWLAEQNQNGWLQPLENEDAALGIYLAGTPTNLVDLTNISDRQSNRMWDTSKNLSKCNGKDFLIHYLTEISIQKAEDNFQRCGNACGCIPPVQPNK